MALETASTSAAWFDDDLDERLTPEVLMFFSSYSHIQPTALKEHLHAMHHRAWSICPYPCVGQWGFLAPKIANSPAYVTILQRVNKGDLILDLGCCMGQDLRCLAADGAPTANMYGADIEPAFWELGFELFKDRGRFQGQFLNSDILDETAPSDTQATASLRRRLHGKVDIIYAGSVLHLWDFETQLKAVKNMILLCKPNALIVACQLGSVEALDKPAFRGSSKTMFFHDVESIKRLWKRATVDTNTKWSIEARLVDLKVLLPFERDSAWMSKTNRGLLFEAIRIDSI